MSHEKTSDSASLSCSFSADILSLSSSSSWKNIVWIVNVRVSLQDKWVVTLFANRLKSFAFSYHVNFVASSVITSEKMLELHARARDFRQLGRKQKNHYEIKARFERHHQTRRHAPPCLGRGSWNGEKVGLVIV
ncbi:U2 snRNP auxilliary factor [Striga asiatica]|uniref:U2 snRNP auxilliary factor n=1 Tax=Striga asiatica TaxID=4170 RepID=A0A5A7PEW7_STRAF|nr:U2 snRNP auxilliary factor [Striga asiatica]